MKSISEVIGHLADSGVEVYLSGDKLKARSLKDGLTPELLRIMKVNKAEIIEYLNKQSETKGVNLRPPIISVDRSSKYLLPSFAQQRLWFLDQMDGDSSHYNMPSVMRLTGQFNVSVAQQAYTYIIQRHETLRTVFIDNNEGTFQVINDSFNFKISEIDFTDLTLNKQRQAIQTAINEDAKKPFDLSRDLMLRVGYLRLNNDTGIMLFNMHHIASDGWSIGVLVDEFVQCYSAILNNETPSLKPLAIQYADYAHWQNKWLKDGVLEKQLTYWRNQLSDLPTIHSLPLDFERPKIQTFKGGKYEFSLDHQILSELKQIALENNVTLFMLIHAAFSILIARYSNNDDVVIGTPVANRLKQELEPLIGFFVNTLVLRVDCSSDVGFAQFINQVKTIHVNAQSNQDVPFEQLVDYLQPERSTSHNALFQIMFSMNTNDDYDLTLPGLEIIPERQSEDMFSKFDLSLSAQTSLTEESDLLFTYEYSTDLFTLQRIERFAKSLVHLLKGIVNNPQQNILSLPLVNIQDTERLLHDFNATEADYSRDLCLHQLVELQVKQTPNKIALIFQDRALTYQELNDKANQLAHHLVAQGIKPEVVVGLYTDRSIEMILGILAILKSGAAYLPLDPGQPIGKIDHMINDAGLFCLLTQNHLSEKLVKSKCIKIILDDKDFLKSLGNLSIANPTVDTLTPNNLAYIIYTSGSTGLPKGVMITHRNSVHSVSSRIDFYTQPMSGFLLVSPMAFDSSVAGMMWSLCSGGQLIVPRTESIIDPDALLKLIQIHKISHTLMTPALYSALLSIEDLPISAHSLDVVIVAGESFSNSLPKQHHKLLPNTQLYNEYGPTEGSVWSTVAELFASSNEGDHPISIGKPVNNVRLYVLGQHKNLLPMGSTGELYIAGDGVARGYLNQVKLTAEKFMEHELTNGLKERLYQTGDLVRYLDDGRLIFVGRTDEQVKIRGYRIELGEIQHHLTTHSNINKAVVQAYSNNNLDTQLIAYFTSNFDFEEKKLIADIKLHLQQHLSAYMIPSFFILLDSFPLTKNGKIDRAALPLPETMSLEDLYVKPENSIQKALVKIWSKLLNTPVDRISAHANFFSSGGHSLLSIRLLSAVRAKFDCELTVRDIFDCPKLSDFSEKIINTKKGRRPKVKKVVRSNNQLTPSFAQERLWFIDQMDGGSAHYNIPSAMRIMGDFKLDVAEQAFIQIIQRHEVLRTVFVDNDNGPIQFIYDDFNFHILEIDLTEMSDSDQDLVVENRIKEDANTSFDLSKDIMLRVSYLHLCDHSGVLIFNVHHIAADGWSIGILTREFVQLYSAIVCGKKPLLDPLNIQYADYAAWQRSWVEGEELKKQLHYWENKLADLPQLHSFPLDFKRPQIQTFVGALHKSRIEESISTSLQKLAERNQVTLFMVIHAIFSIVIARYSNNNDVVIGTPVANRLEKDLEPLIGFFVNTLVLRADCSKDLSFTDFLKQIKETNLGAQTNQDLPFEHLVDHLNPERTTSHNALFQIMLSMNNNESYELALPGTKLDSVTSDRVSAKFDLMINVHFKNELEISYQYNKDLFSEQSIKRLADNTEYFISEITSNPTKTITQLSLTNKQETDYLLHTLNDTPGDFQTESCIHHLFENQVKRTPQNLALVYENQSLTYLELNIRANQLARHLIDQLVKPNDIIGICVDRSIDMIVVVLGVLKSGAAYLPLDPAHPQSRLEHIVNETQLRLLVTVEKYEGLIQVDHQVLIDQPQSIHAIERQLKANPENKEVSSENLAYVIYTSGSTGLPKGVLQKHQTITNLVYAQSQNNGLKSNHRTLQFAPLTFDVSIQEIATSFFTGSPLILISNQVKESLHKLPAFIDQLAVERLFLPPAVLNLFSDIWLQNNQLLSDLKEIVVAGEALTVSDSLKRYLKTHPNCKLWNHYGPTETHVVTISAVNPELEFLSQPIGHVIANLNIYVLGDNLELLPFGAVGELYVSGTGVAKGYINQEKLTAERFVVSPFNPKEIIYRTGDLVRYLPNGSLEFHGRTDSQVQIRGFRIEPGEIEYQLTQLDWVSCGLVDVQSVSNNESAQLVAYFTTDKKLAEKELIEEVRKGMSKLLADYMVPSVFILMKEFPLTVNGKIDREKLPHYKNISSTKHVSPEGDTEVSLAQMWAKLLKTPLDTINTQSNFFELGGHSLLSVRLLSEIQTEFNCELSIRDIFDNSELSLLARKIADSSQSIRTKISPMDRSINSFKPSYAQQRLWFVDQMDQGRSNYTLPYALRIKGEFNISAAELTFKQIINRHESLRTVFEDRRNGLMQVIKKQFNFNISEIDLTHLSEKEQKDAKQSAVKSNLKQSFDLTKDLMLKVSYVHLSKHEGVLLINLHHISADGWSIGILTEEFISLYQSNLNKDGDSVLKPLKIQYADYAHWQRKWLKSDALEKQLTYWGQQLANLPQVHSLPLDFDRPQYQTFKGATHTFRIDRKTTEPLQVIVSDNKVTMFMLIHAIFAVLIHRYSNSSDVVIGTPVANRTQKELQPLIGFFVNTLVLRNDCSGNPRFVDFLNQIKNINLGAQANQDVPFEYLVDRLNPVRSLNCHTLFQIMLSINTIEHSELILPNAQVEPEVTNHDVIAKFDLTLMADLEDQPKSQEGIEFCFEYNKDLFKKESIEKLAESLVLLFSHVADDPTERIGSLELISDAEKNFLMYQLNEAETIYPKNLCVHQQFEQQATLTPESYAVSFGNQSLSYNELNKQANQLAHFLMEQGIRPGTKVGLCFDRSFNLIIGQLGLFKLGAAYVPLDPILPKARLEYIINDSDLSVVLTNMKLKDLVTSAGVKCFDVDCESFMRRISERSQSNPVTKKVKPEDLAYMIYTSGSTGQPKGALNTHLGLNNLSHWHIKKFNVNADKVGSHLTSIGFDAALWDVWPYLIAGGKVQLIPDHIRVSPKELVSYLNQYHVTHSFLPTALLESSYEFFDSKINKTIEYIFAGGEQLNKHGFLNCRTRLINIYGPSESSVVTAFYDVGTKTNNRPPPIGKPVDNFRLYIMNDQRSLMPFKSTGELYIAGDGLAIGYHNNAELTVEKFIEHTFNDGHKEKLYQTGDLVRYLDNGLLDFVARVDNQVKIRGFRIEPGEIEFQLSELEQVYSAVVLVEKDQYGSKLLSAYVVLNEAFKKLTDIGSDIRNDLKSVLPSHMIPKYLTVLEEFPLTPNGKIDKQQLAGLVKKIHIDNFIAPSSELEKTLIDVLASELQLTTDSISMNNNFFDIGGNSISLLSVINQLNECSYDINLKLFYECENLKEICLQHSFSDSTIISDSLIKLNQCDQGNPLYLFHPMGGRADCYKGLATNLEFILPVLGIQAPFVSKHDVNFNNIETLTDIYTESILRHQPDGPYRLGGWSLGGMLAQKVVEKLNSINKEVEYFVGMDCFMEMPFMQQKKCIDALYETVAFALNKPVKEVKDLLREVEDQEFEQQLDFAVNMIKKMTNSEVTDDYLNIGLKFGVNIFKAKINQTKQFISKQASLFIAAENGDKSLLLEGWQNTLDAQTLRKEVEGTHLNVLEGDSLEQITVQISSDIKALKK